MRLYRLQRSRSSAGQSTSFLNSGSEVRVLSGSPIYLLQCSRDRLVFVPFLKSDQTLTVLDLPSDTERVDRSLPRPVAAVREATAAEPHRSSLPDPPSLIHLYYCTANRILPPLDRDMLGGT
jgi:hypothetical protein